MLYMMNLLSVKRPEDELFTKKQNDRLPALTNGLNIFF